MRRFFLFCSAVFCVAYAGQAIAAGYFTDVPDGVPYAQAINDWKEKGIVNGYADGTFGINHSLTRAEFIQLLVNAELPTKGEPCRPSQHFFDDVPAGSWYYQAVCFAKRKGIVQGYADTTFHPASNITFAEASKMIALAFAADTPASAPWYKSSIAYLSEQKAIPLGIGSADQWLTRGEAVEILWRLKEGRHDLPFATVAGILAAKCTWIRDNDAAGVDMERVKAAWLQWMNDIRATENLPAYDENRQLDRTAFLWSSTAAAKGAISHQRSGQTVYYDYPRMVGWFSALGLEFANEQRVTMTENIGWGYYACGQKNDCTEGIIAAIRTTFDFYLSEKTKNNRHHYDSIMNAHFHSIGVGIALDWATKKYFITTHYATSITSNPPPVCP
jgi:uncharacterized protein YkwD